MLPIAVPRTVIGRCAKADSWARFASVLAILLILACASCGAAAERAQDMNVTLTFTPDPPRTGPAVCKLRLSTPAGDPIVGAQVRLEGNMNHAGMVPVFRAASEQGAGLYEAPFEFTMGGDWFVVVRAELADGSVAEATLDVPNVLTPTSPELR